ncbi:DUF7288 family protein [Halovivax gelatinilyticus]|uniref:DUF7288 family protein n=1 Tax=Halovivax gelatinilyticus TaxID=2961597 RepID=UPI0020CA9B7D|nr:hypothetical protein [Halovivax gelatinilyticus]
MRDRSPTTDERGQAFTLEGFVAAIVLLTAVLFALQAVVITPTTGGAVDRGVQAQAEQEVKDVVMTGAASDDLSKLVRYYDNESEEWIDATFGEDADFVYNNSAYANVSDFGYVLNTHFFEHGGNSYNVEYIYWEDENNRSTTDAVRMGGARGQGAVSASFTVTLYESQNLTVSGSNGPEESDETVTLEVAHDQYDYPIPPMEQADDSEVYNIVEVRVTVW